SIEPKPRQEPLQTLMNLVSVRQKTSHTITMSTMPACSMNKELSTIMLTLVPISPITTIFDTKMITVTLCIPKIKTQP
ncbi:hypothetical protein VIGAN_03285100, partial [Vigna angularis var. angularis]